MSYTIKDNTKEVLASMEKALRTGLEVVGLTAEDYAIKAVTQQKTYCICGTLFSLLELAGIYLIPFNPEGK